MADFRIAGPFGQYGALPKKRQQIQISESVKDVAELETRLQRAEELLDMAADSLRAGGLMTVAKRIDAFRGGHDDD